jgi:MOSC domain-containing protein
MQTDATSSVAGQTQAGSVVALWRYPVKSMMGEEVNSSAVTDRGLLGDRQFAVVDRAAGKVGGPRKWGNFIDFRATYAEAPKLRGRISPVRITLPDGDVVSNDRADLKQILSRAFGRDIAFVDARAEQMTSGVAEEYWPDVAGLEYRDTVTDFEMPAGTFFDIAVVHLLTTSTIDRLRELYPQGRFPGSPIPPQHHRHDRQRGSRLHGERLDRQHGRDRRHRSPGHHRTMPPLRDDHAAAGRPTQRLRNPPDGRSATQ